MKFFKLRLFFLGTILMVACESIAKPIEIPTYASLNLSGIVSEIKQREKLLETIQGVCQLNMESDEKRGNFSGVLLVQRPDRFRLLGYRSFIGSTAVLDILLQGSKFSLYLPSENKVLRGNGTNIRFFSGKEMMTSFFGFADRTFILLEETPELYFFALLTPEGKFQQTLKVQKQSLWVQEQTFYQADGAVHLHIQYRQYQKVGTLYWPYEVDIIQFQPKNILRIRFKEIELNVPLQPEAFLQEIPEDATEEPTEIKK
ncbi:MAG: DUF4292 domain-containing protein [Planctomycetota bacterium]